MAEQKGELLAFILMKGCFSENNFSIIIENPALNKVIYYLLKQVFSYNPTIKKIRGKKKKNEYIINISGYKEISKILAEFKLKITQNGKILEKQIKKKQNNNNKISHHDYFAKAFLRGAFLAGGFVNDPERMYHLQIACSLKTEAEAIQRMLQQNSFLAKTSFWQKKWIVYMKKSEHIFEFLRFIGVQRALLNFQDIVARKDILNKVNRLVNCETANLDKTINSASKQLMYIEIVKKNISLKNLPVSLVEVINARSANPYSSIQELANIIGGNISKSGIYHRLKKIEQIAEKYISEEITN